MDVNNTDEETTNEQYKCVICNKKLQSDKVIWYEDLDGVFIPTCSTKHYDAVENEIQTFAINKFL